jgi:succinate dehydrogenase hydrophobic anchor subunit
MTEECAGVYLSIGTFLGILAVAVSFTWNQIVVELVGIKPVGRAQLAANILRIVVLLILVAAVVLGVLGIWEEVTE